MTIDAQSIITLAAVIAAIVALVGYYNKAFKWVKKQDAQDESIKSIKSEQAILVNGILACLKGLQEQGCDGPVTKAIAQIEEHLNEKAHQ